MLNLSVIVLSIHTAQAANWMLAGPIFTVTVL